MRMRGRPESDGSAAGRQGFAGARTHRNVVPNHPENSVQAGRQGRRALHGQAHEGADPVPRVLITDKLRSCGAARRELMPPGRAAGSQRPEQPGREQPPARPPARARRERLPLRRRRTEDLVRVERCQPALPAWPAPGDRRPTPARDDPSLRRLGPRHRRHRPARCGLNQAPNRRDHGLPAPSGDQALDNVTASEVVLAQVLGEDAFLFGWVAPASRAA